MIARRVIAGGIVLGLASCGASMPSRGYDVTLSDSGKLALVTPTSDAPTIAGIERAAERAAPWGCDATAAPVIYDLAGGDRNAVLPASAALRFAGRIPATLSCG
ncbi:hypothetical protein SAMN05428995_102116 [Loktanella sp. DSM 29012]|uniref:hypothetical protein n=1 Tax=Loktanella sp. DSM 29012 TaxID=1881056 RepID=UPI0008D72B9A|nr:hypothetical protein [Loktanella sp. DSM 29012]SEP94998.1 hypothetical protein SAMN05428995_102116 [Loktanella sp. DSM 29012]